MKIGANNAPTAAPTGNPPISAPIVLCDPADLPKYRLKVAGVTLDKYARQNPK